MKFRYLPASQHIPTHFHLKYKSNMKVAVFIVIFSAVFCVLSAERQSNRKELLTVDPGSSSGGSNVISKNRKGPCSFTRCKPYLTECCPGLTCRINKCIVPQTDLCKQQGQECNLNRQCCSGLCGGGTIFRKGKCTGPQVCQRTGEKCVHSSECCAGRKCKDNYLLSRGTCTTTSGCLPARARCRRNSSCCRGMVCAGDGWFKRGRCQKCRRKGKNCRRDSDCCSKRCRFRLFGSDKCR